MESIHELPRELATWLTRDTYPPRLINQGHRYLRGRGWGYMFGGTENQGNTYLRYSATIIVDDVNLMITSIFGKLLDRRNQYTIV